MDTVTLEVPEAQVVELVRKLSPTGKQAALRALIPDLNELDSLLGYGSGRIRELCARRGLDWDNLTEEQRAQLVDELLHAG